ncbi:MAG: ATP-binding protein [Gemmatimonadaceae bacterium]
MTPEPIILSWSGGKDSSLALDALRADPSVEVVGLMTTVTAGYDRISIHGVRRALLDAQVASIGLPLYEISITPQSSNEAYDAAVERALADLRLRHPAVRRIAYGDLFLEDVRQYREERLEPLGYKGIFPLWGRPTAALARDFVDRGFEARLVCVDTTQLDGTFAGRAFDDSLLDAFPASVDPCGERGEFHTFVSGGPIFSAPVRYEVGEVVLRDGRFSYCDLLPSP